MNIPISLIIFRLILAPLILCLAYFIGDAARGAIVVLMYLGLISDILDGIIARKQKISTATLRRMDSQTDLVFWLSIGFSTWMLSPEVISANAIPIALLFFFEISKYVISFIKFRKEICTHSFLSNLWGITLLTAFTSILAFNFVPPLYLAVAVGIISQIDVILIILILPKWTHDIPSSYHANLIRKGIKFERNIFLNG